MKLRSLALNQFKKFTAPTRLDGIGDGLNVVVGPNEMGKSTLLDALRAALFEKYSSKAQPITALQNDRNQAGPVVELTFELDDGLYRIAKRFIKKPYARLSCPDGRTLEGDAAEDTLRHLLGFDEPGKTGAKAETLGMWNVLWVQQGQSFGGLDLPESARSNLHSALESEVGTVLGGRRGRALPQAIEKQLGELVTGSTGRPRGAYKELIDCTATLQDELEDLRRRRQELSQTLDELEEAQDTLARLSSGDRDQADRKELDDARKRHSQLSELEARIQAAASDLELKKRNLDQAQEARTERTRLKETIASESEAVKAAGKRRDEVREQEKETRSQRDALRSQVRDAEAAVTKADEAVSRQRRILAAVDRQGRIQQLQAQCEKAQAAEKRQQEAQQGAAAILVTDDAITAIREAAKGVETIESRLSAAATRVTFDMTPDGLEGIEVDGAALTAGQPSLQAIEPTTISIPDRGRITVEPAIKDRDKLLRQKRQAGDKLKEVLETAGAKTVEDAEEQYARRQKLLQDAELARQEAALHAPATDDYEAGAQALSDHVEGLRQVLARETDALALEDLPARDEAETALRTAQEEAEKARSTLESARASLAGPDEALSRLQTDLGTVGARYEDAKDRLEKLQQQLQEAEQTHSDDELAAAVEAAQTALSEQQTVVSDLEAQRTDETLPQLEARIGRLEKAIQDRQEKRQSLKVTISGLKSRIEAAEGAGLDEAIAQKSRELELAVLVRLAFAEMLVEQGHPATVVLDDALVFSDDRRMSRMFDILNMAARNVQVIIFTCREQLFEDLGGQPLSLAAGTAEELVSA